VFETIFLISPQLNNDAILGCQFLREHGVSINFSSETFEYVRNGVTRERVFAPKATMQGACSNDSGGVIERRHPEGTSTGPQIHPTPVDCGESPSRSKAADSCNGSLNPPTVSGREASHRLRHGLRIEPGPLDPARNQEFPDPDPTKRQMSARGECAPASVANSPRSSVTARLRAQPPPELEVNSVETALLHGHPLPKP
jgi:hypothetical protein